MYKYRKYLSIKLAAIFTAILLILNSVSHFMVAFAADPTIQSTLELGWSSTSDAKGYIRPGEEMEITVSLKNYNAANNPLIYAIQIEIPLDTSLLEYVSGSGSTLIAVESTDTNQIAYINGTIKFVYVSLNSANKPLSKPSTASLNLFKFKVKAKSTISANTQVTLEANKVTFGNENSQGIIIGGPKNFSAWIYITVPVSWNSLTANGTSNSSDTTELTLVFDKEISGLTASNITVTGAAKGALSGGGTTWKLGISNLTVANGESVTVAITNPTGFNITPASKTVTVYRSTSSVTWTELSADGKSYETETTELTLVFDKAITGLTAGNITVTGATKGALTGSGTTWKLAISNITVANGANVTVALSNPTGFNITPASKTVTVYKAPTNVTWSNLTANGADNSVTTTDLTLTFSAAVPGLTAANFSVTGATKGTLSGSGPTYTLSVSNISVANKDLIEVSLISNPTGYIITPTSKTATVYKAPSIVTWNSLTANGSDDVSTTTALTLTFNQSVTGLTAANFEVTGATKGTLTGSGTTWYLAVSGINSNGSSVTVRLASSPAGFSINTNPVTTPVSKTVTVWKEPASVAWSNLQADGSNNSKTTTILTLTFSESVTELTADNFNVTGAAKGTLTGSGSTYTLSITNITVANGEYVTVQLINNPAGYIITPTHRTVQVYKAPVSVTWNDLKAGGTDNFATTDMLTLTFSQAVTGLTANNFNVTGATKGLLSGSGATWHLGITDITSNGASVTVQLISNPAGFDITPASKSVTVWKAPISAAWDNLSANGTDNAQTTTTLTLTFSESITGLTAANFNVIGAAKGVLSGSGKTYTLEISNIAKNKDSVEVQLVSSPTGYSITPASKTVTVFKAPANVTWTGLTANGDSTTTTTVLTLTFSEPVTGLSIDNFELTGAGIGTLTGSGTKWYLGISDILLFGHSTITLKLKSNPAGYNISTGSASNPLQLSVTVYKVPPEIAWLDLTANGSNFSETTTVLTLMFESNVTGLEANHFHVMGADVVSLSGTGTIWELTIANITVPNGAQVTVQLIDHPSEAFTIIPASRTVTVWKAPANVTWTGLTANGTDSITTTTELTLTFSEAVSGLTTDNFTVIGATKGSLLTPSPDWKTWTLEISDIVRNGHPVEVRLSNPTGYIISTSPATAPSAKTVEVWKTPANIELKSVTANGSDNSVTTTALTLTFSGSIEGLTADNFIVIGASVGDLTGSGPTYTLSISDITVASGEDIKVQLVSNPLGYNITPASWTVSAYKAPKSVIWNDLTANGTNNFTTTTMLTFTFSEAVKGLTAGNFNVTGATKESLTGSGSIWYLGISDIVSNESTVTVQIASSPIGYDITPESNTVTVYKAPVSVVWENLTANGINNSETTTSLTLTFSEAVEGLTADHFIVTGATIGILSPVPGDEKKWTLGISNITVANGEEVTVQLRNNPDGIGINPTGKKVAVYKEPISVTWNTLTANGTDNFATTTALTMTFSKDVTGLTSDNFKVNGASKGTLTGSGQTWILWISDVKSNGTSVTVELNRSPAGYVITPQSKTVTLWKEPTSVTWNTLTANGTDNSKDTTELTLKFDKAITNLSASHITVTGATKGALTGSGTTWNLAISNITVANGNYVTVALTNPTDYRINPTSKSVMVYRVLTVTKVNWTGLTVNGTNGPANTAELILTFDKAITGLTANDIIVTGATKGALTGNGTTWKLVISNITASNEANVTITLTNPAGYSINPASKSIAVPSFTNVNWTGLTANGTSGSANTTELTLTFDKAITGLKASDITVTGATKGALTGSGATWKLGISNITVANGSNVTVTLSSPAGYVISPASRTTAVYTAASSTEPTSQTGTTIKETYLLGDADQDRKVTVKDATTVQKHVAKILKLQGKALRAADADEDSKVTVKDATIIQKYVAKIKVNSRVGQEIPE